MPAVLNIKPAVIVLWIVSAIFPALPLCLVSFIQLSFSSLLPIFSPTENACLHARRVTRYFLAFGSFAASPAGSSVRQYPV